MRLPIDSRRRSLLVVVIIMHIVIQRVCCFNFSAFCLFVFFFFTYLCVEMWKQWGTNVRYFTLRSDLKKICDCRVLPLHLCCNSDQWVWSLFSIVLISPAHCIPVKNVIVKLVSSQCLLHWLRWEPSAMDVVNVTQSCLRCCPQRIALTWPSHVITTIIGELNSREVVTQHLVAPITMELTTKYKTTKR